MEDHTVMNRFWETSLGDLAKIIGHEFLECPIAIRDTSQMIRKCCELSNTCQSLLQDIERHSDRIEETIRIFLFGTPSTKGILEVRLIPVPYTDRERKDLSPTMPGTLSWAWNQPVEQVVLFLADDLHGSGMAVGEIISQFKAQCYPYLPTQFQGAYALIEKRHQRLFDLIDMLLQGVLLSRIQQELSE
jgi:hypothetical protein